jgi:hypothetical protein
MTSGNELPPGNVVVLSAGRDLRVCADYQGQVRALLWLNIGRDGSLYTSYCARRTQPGFRLIPEVLADGSSRFTWDRKEVAELDPEREKVSFHASGLIYARIGWSVGINLRLLTQRTHLCTYFPRHPSYWPVVKAPRQRDLVVRELLQDECPITVELYYQPAGELPVMPTDLTSGRFVLPVGYLDVEGHGRVLLHLVFCRQPGASSWPPSWVIAWPKLGARAAPLEAERWFEP